MIHSGRLPVASIFRTGRICTPGHSNCYLIIDDYKSFVDCRLRPRLRVRNNKLHSQREICSAGHEPKLLWSLSLWNRNALFAVARVCSRILLLDSCVRRPVVYFAGRESAIRKSKYSTRKKFGLTRGTNGDISPAVGPTRKNHEIEHLTVIYFCKINIVIIHTCTYVAIIY